MEWRTFTSLAFMPAESWKESFPKDATSNIPLKSNRGGVKKRRKMSTGLMWLGN